MIATKDKAASPTELKIRVLAIKAKLPGNVRALLFDRFPAYDTAKGAKKIDNVLTGASSDEDLTVFLESLVAVAA